MCKKGGARHWKCTVCSLTVKKTGRIIQDNKNAFGFRGQTVFIISHNHSWLPFNAGLAVFMERKLLVSKQWKVLVLRVVGWVTTAHWCILCFIAASWRTQKTYSSSLSPLCSVPLHERQEHYGVIHCHTSLKGPICEHTRQLKWKASSVSFVFFIATCLVISHCRWLGRHLWGSRHTCPCQQGGRELQSAEQGALHLRSGTHAVWLGREDLLPQWDLVWQTAVLQA